MFHRLKISGAAILLGWSVLFAFTYLVERPLLRWTPPLLGASWVPTVQLTLACCGLVAAGWFTGWITRRWTGFGVLPTALGFAATLALSNAGPEPPLNAFWILRLLLDSFGDSRYLESFVTALAATALLLGSLMAGAMLSRPRKAVEIRLFPTSR